MWSNYGPYLVILVIMIYPFVKCQQITGKDNSSMNTNDSTSKSANNGAVLVNLGKTNVSHHNLDQINDTDVDEGSADDNSTSVNSTKPEKMNVTSTVGMTCYQCRTDVDAGCDDENVSEEHLKPCNLKESRSYQDIELSDNVFRSEQLFCRKIVQYIKFVNNTPMTIVARECTVYHKNVDECYTEITQAFTLTVCECRTEGCNTSTFNKRISRLLLVLALSLLIFPHFPP